MRLRRVARAPPRDPGTPGPEAWGLGEAPDTLQAHWGGGASGSLPSPPLPTTRGSAPGPRRAASRPSPRSAHRPGRLGRGGRAADRWAGGRRVRVAGGEGVNTRVRGPVAAGAPAQRMTAHIRILRPESGTEPRGHLTPGPRKAASRPSPRSAHRPGAPIAPPARRPGSGAELQFREGAGRGAARRRRHLRRTPPSRCRRHRHHRRSGGHRRSRPRDRRDRRDRRSRRHGSRHGRRPIRARCRRTPGRGTRGRRR